SFRMKSLEASGFVIADATGSEYGSYVLGAGQEMGIQLYGDATLGFVAGGLYGVIVSYLPRVQQTFEHAELFDIMGAGGPFAVGFLLGFGPAVLLGWPRKARRLALLGMTGCVMLSCVSLNAQNMYVSIQGGLPSF